MSRRAAALLLCAGAGLASGRAAASPREAAPVELAAPASRPAAPAAPLLPALAPTALSAGLTAPAAPASAPQAGLAAPAAQAAPRALAAPAPAASAAGRAVDADELEYAQARDAAALLLREHPPGASRFVGVGRSPAILVALLQSLDPALASNLPLSDFYHHPEGRAPYYAPLSPEEEGRLFDHFDRQLPPDTLSGERTLVLLDWVTGGRAMIALDEYLKVYRAKRHPALRWEMTALALPTRHVGLEEAGRSYRLILPADIGAVPSLLHARMSLQWHKEDGAEYGSFAAPFDGPAPAPKPQYAAWRARLKARLDADPAAAPLKSLIPGR